MTDERWWLGDLSLDGPSYRLQTMPEGPVPMRGSDLTVAGRDGQVRQPKRLDGRMLTAIVQVHADDGMWHGSRSAWQSAVDRFYRTLYGPDLELRRWLRLPGGTVSDRTIAVEPAGGFQVDPVPPGLFGRVALQLWAADPRWYERSDSRIVGASGTFTVPHRGTVRHRRGLLRLHGPATNPTFTLSPQQSSVTFQGTIGAGQWVDIDAWQVSAVDHNGTPVGGLLQRSGPGLFEFAAGQNEATLSAGSCDLTYRLAWL